MTFNDKVDNFMKINGYENLKQLAKDCGIPYTTLRDFYEKQSADNSRLSTIRKLSKFMKCSMDYLAYDDVENPNEIKLDGINDIDDNDENIYTTRLTLCEPTNKINDFVNFLKDNNIQYEIINRNSSKANEQLNELDQILFSKAKQLNDDEKKAIISVIDAIHKDVDKELNN